MSSPLSEAHDKDVRPFLDVIDKLREVEIDETLNP